MTMTSTNSVIKGLAAGPNLTARLIAFIFSIALFSAASVLFIRSALDYSSQKHQFLKDLNLSGFTKIQLNDQIQFLYLQQLHDDSNSVLMEIISKETGFNISKIKTYVHQGKSGSTDQVSLSIAEVNFDANGSLLNSKPERHLYVFFIKNFKIQSAQRITSVKSNAINLEFGSLKKYNPQFAEGTYQISENIDFN
jgi:hypothetical protein